MTLHLKSPRVGGTLIALKSYFDGSHDGGGWTTGNLVTLAGFAADDALLPAFDRDWQAVLDDDRERPRAKYLHMKELRKKEGIFSPSSGWNDQRRIKLVIDLLQYMQTLDKKRCRLFGCSLDLRAHRQAIADGCRLAHPMKICNHFVPQLALAWFVQEFPGFISEAHFYFDVKEPFRHYFEKLWEQKKRDRLDENREAYQLIKSVGVVDARDTPAMQAADLMAWGMNRTLTAKEGEFMKHLAFMIKQIVPNYTIYLSTESLKKIRVAV